MLKNKKSLYILLPSVLIIWGLIIYRIFSGVGNDPDRSIIPVKQTTVEDLISIKDTFSISADYRDPFLGKVFNQTVMNVPDNHSGSTHKEPIVTKPDIPVNYRELPHFIYKGTVINKTDNSPVAIIQFNGKKLLIKKNERFNDIRIDQIYFDSVKVEFDKRMYTIYK
jgi:hypothetical protein